LVSAGCTMVLLVVIFPAGRLVSAGCTMVAGSVIQTIQDGLRESYECLASAPISYTARQMVFNSPWLTAEKEFGSPLQTALVCNSNPLMVARLPKTGWLSLSIFFG
ncbi:hypothetical protein Tco_0219807, partial [Tanacetum coccineum]